MLLPDFLEEMRRHVKAAQESPAAREFNLRQAERYAAMSMAESLHVLASKPTLHELARKATR